MWSLHSVGGDGGEFVPFPIAKSETRDLWRRMRVNIRSKALAHYQQRFFLFGREDVLTFIGWAMNDRLDIYRSFGMIGRVGAPLLKRQGQPQYSRGV